MYNDIESDIEEFLDEGYAEVEAAMEAAGESAVAYNIENGSYHDVTGNLRRSNMYEVIKDGRVPTELIVGNDAEYASDVEARGKMVVSGGALLADAMLKG